MTQEGDPIPTATCSICGEALVFVRGPRQIKPGQRADLVALFGPLEDRQTPHRCPPAALEAFSRSSNLGGVYRRRGSESPPAKDMRLKP